jgi:sortase A
VQRAGRILSTALITAGVVVLLDVGLTLAYREPISSVYGSIKQGDAAADLEQLESRYPGPAELRRIAAAEGSRAKVRILARRFGGAVSSGEGIGRIEAPAADGLDAVIVEGTDTGSLQGGPGHYPQTPFPGAGGTSAIAGHRTTYLAPFRHIDSLDRGDRITLKMPYATLSYRVQRSEVVDPSRVDVIDPVGYDRLVLSACHPLYSADERYIVFARLLRATLFDSARGGRFPAN